MARTTIDKLRQELDILGKSLEKASQGVERFTRNYEASKTALSSTVEQLKQISQQYKIIADNIRKLESLKGLKEQYEAVQKLQASLQSLELGTKFKARPERFSAIVSPLSQAERAFKELEKFTSENIGVSRFFTKSIYPKFDEIVAKNLKQYLESVYGNLDDELSSIRTTRAVTFRTLAKELGLTLPPGFKGGEFKYLRLEAEQGFDPSISPEKFQKNLDIVIDTVTGEVKSLQDFLKDVDRLLSGVTSTVSKRTVKEKAIKASDIQKDIEKSISNFSEIPTKVKTELIKRLQEEFKDAQELVRIHLSKTAAGTRIRASAGQKTVSIDVNKLLSQLESEQKKQSEEIKRDLYTQIRERIDTFTHLSRDTRDKLSNIIYASIKDSIDIIKNFEADLDKGVIRLKGKKLDTGTVISTKFPILSEFEEEKGDDIILRQRLITLSEQELQKIREKFGESAVNQIQALARNYIGALEQYQYIGYEIGTPSLTKRFGDVFPIQFTKRQLDVEEPLATARTAISLEGGKVTDVLAVKRAELEEQNRIAELKRKLQSIPGLLEIVNNELKRVGSTIKDVQAVDLLKLDDDLVEVRILQRDLEKLADTRRIVGRISERGFVEDPRFKIKQYMLQQRLAANEEIAEMQSQKVSEILQKYGFNLASTRLDIRTQSPADITYFTARMGDATTGIKQLTVALNKYNDVITYSNRRTMDFLDAIRSYTGDVFRWSIGATLVYGTYRKLSEAISIAIENETKLVQIGVVLGRAQENLNTIFKSAYEIAKETGEGITGVLDAYTLAYRAVGGIADQAEKSAAASELLTNSLVLSKLSALSAAESIDILSGALRQMQQPGESTSTAFRRATQLLDAWVTVTRHANVDLATLATAFSIVEESASNVGLTLEEINGVIAALAEKAGGYSGRETGNAIRMIIGGLYTNQAEIALARFGIATKNANGELRNFLDISKDIYRLYSAGIIAPDQLSKLAYAIGGGVRNQQRVQWFLSDLPRIAEIVAIQSEKTGASQEALSQITETLATKVELLNNSFQNFAHVLGTRGGVLEQTKGLVSLFTILIDAATKLVDILGNFTLPVALLTLIGLFTRSDSGMRRWAAFTTGIDTWLLGTRFAKDIGVGKEDQFFNISKLTGRTGIGTLIGAFTALPEIDKAIRGQKESWYVVGGTIAGGILGALTGNPALSYLGAVIGKEFVSTVIQSGKDMGAAILPVVYAPTPTEEVITSKTPTEIRKRSLFKQYEKYLYPGLQKFVGIATIPEEFKFGEGTVYLPPQELRTRETLAAYRAMMIIKQYEEGRKVGALGQAAAYLPSKEQYEAAKEFLAKLEDLEKRQLKPVPSLENTFIARFTKQYAEFNAKFLNNLVESQKEVMKTDFFRGIYSLADFGRIKKNIEAFGGFAAQIEAIKALGQQRDIFKGLNEELLKAIPSADELISTFVYVTDEARAQNIEFVSSITDLANAIEQAGGGTVKFGNETLTTAEAVDRLNLYIQMLNSGLKSTEKLTNQMRFEKIKSLIPQAVDLSQVNVEKDFQKILDKAYELQEIRAKALVSAGVLTEEEIRFMMKNAPLIMAELGKELGVRLVEGLIDPSLLQDAFKELLMTGDIKIGLDYQFLDVTQAQFKAILGQYQAIRQAILQAGGKSEETPLLTFFKDSNNPFNYKMDWKIVQHLLSQILETEKKQLDGIYNLPSEATAWVPFQSLQYAYQKGLNEAQPTTLPITPPDFTPVDNASTNTGNKLTELGNAAEMAEKRLRYLGMREEQSEPTQPPSLAPTPTVLPDTWFEMLKRNLLPQLPSNQGRTLPDTLEGMFNRTVESLQSLVNKINSIQINPTNPNTYYQKKDADMILTPQQMQIPQLSTSLKLDFRSSIQLVVDGRTLATVVKNYIWEDLVKYVNSSTAATQSYTII